MVGFRLEGLNKTFNGTRAVDALSLEVADGAFLALLGPSGCGKTTVLRLLAGLERPDGGTIAIGDRVVAGPGTFVEPEERGLGMVFQSYALWPHMSVAGNVSFALHGKGLAAADIARRTDEALSLVGLRSRAEARPHQLSGGQRQRVALARSLALRPKLLLLDEPLANLDPALRAGLAAEFRRLHAETRTTFVFVTHDQAEALALATTIAVLDAGRLQQCAAPEDLWRRPASPAVARFIGDGRLLPVDVLGREGDRLRLSWGSRRLLAPGDAPPGPGWLCVRRQGLTVAGAASDGDVLPGTVHGSRFEGGAYLHDVGLGDASMVDVEVGGPVPLGPGAPVGVRVTDGWVIARSP
ncbi:ABC transporter ATP-binding protein [Aureimonas sp. AU22]|uniref:ABC transporter ATP-binding protein n=1 Tax=Aureimonas sp. AU22 TaxID=1638162 RepID=UPI000783F6DC|nr:ABC transporter ATP-binding protein [Aureimonas sp. AU22]